MEDPDAAAATIAGLRAEGTQVCIDDNTGSWCARSSPWRATSGHGRDRGGRRQRRRAPPPGALECDYPEGYHLSRPVDADTAVRLLTTEPLRLSSPPRELISPREAQLFCG